MNIEGYAFKSDEAERMEKIQKRYREIAHLRKKMTLNKVPRYGRTEFYGTLDTDETRQLSETDIAIIADDGNLCFGGTCTKTGNSFRGEYWID